MLEGIWQDPDLHQCTQRYSSFAKAGFAILFCEEMPNKIMLLAEILY